MNIKNVGSNQIEVSTSKATVLFSYSKPVAAFLLKHIYNPANREDNYIKTDKFWSVTTSKHINKWLSSKGLNPKLVNKVDQSVLDNLIK